MRSSTLDGASDDRLVSRRTALAAIGAPALTPVYALGRIGVFQRIGADPGSAEPLHYLGLQVVAERIAKREVSPIELTDYMLNRIAKVDPQLKAYATVMADHARAAARDAEREIRAGKYRGPLHGVPIAVKDLCYSKGVRTMGGTPVLKNFVPDFDGTVVSKLSQAGAIILGKLNLTEGAMSGYHPAFDIPLNPWDAGRWSGVSSSGSGVASAAGLCFAAIGTDTGGSIRLPASANGVVGLKPTYGRVSRFGVLPLADSLDHVGPIARRVADVAIMFDAIAGFDPKDRTSLRDPAPNTFGRIKQGIKGVRIGVDRDYALTGVDRGQAASIDEALKVLSGLGARIVEVRVPDLTDVAEAWLVLCGAEAVVSHAANYPSRASEYGPYFREFLQLGASRTQAEVAEAKARTARFSREFTTLLKTVDAIACPAGGAPAYPVSREILTGSMTAANAYGVALDAANDPPLKNRRLFTRPMDLAGTPTICLPSGFSPEGLPYSIQFAGRHLSEPMLCQLAYAYENATSWHTRHPKV